MGQYDFSDFGKQIMSSVTKTIEDINKTIQNALPKEWEAKEKVYIPVKESAKSETKPVLQLVFGILMTIIFTGGSIAVTVLQIIQGIFNPGVFLLGGLSLLGIGLIVSGGKRLSFISRFERYIGELEKSGFSDVRRLASVVHKDIDIVKKDLKIMLQRGWFIEGHLDDSGTCFMGTDKCYRQYLEAKKSMEERMSEENKDNPVKDMIAEGKGYISEIRRANDCIEGEEISNKLARLELIATAIFEHVEKHPEKATDIRKFMKYYLPTTLKLVNTYKEYDSQVIVGENIEKGKKEIEETLDKINMAFGNLLNELYGDDMLDVSTDISALSAMLAQEGLWDKDFKMESEKIQN